MTGAASQGLLEIQQCSAFESGTGHGRSSLYSSSLYMLYEPHLPNVMELVRGLQFSLFLSIPPPPPPPPHCSLPDECTRVCVSSVLFINKSMFLTTSLLIKRFFTNRLILFIHFSLSLDCFLAFKD